MNRLSRIATAIVLVATLAVNLGDWPYVDELLGDLNDETLYLPADDDSEVYSVTNTQDNRHDARHGLGYQCLNAFLTVPPIPGRLVDGIHRNSSSARYPAVISASTEFILSGLFRPPAA